MPPHDSRPFWGAALAAALVAAPALAAVTIPPGGAAAQTATAGTLTVGWGDTGFGWSEKDAAPEAAAGSVLSLDEGRVRMGVAPQRDGDTEQPYPLSLRGVTAHPVDGNGRIGEAIDIRPALSIDEVPRDVEAMERGDSPLLTPRRLADTGLLNSSGSAFDVDHALQTEWSFLIPSDAMSAEAAQTDTSGGIAYCVAVDTGGVRTAQDDTAEGGAAQSVLTFRDEDRQLEPLPEPTKPAPTPTTLPTDTPSPVPPAEDEAPGLRDGESAGGLGGTTEEKPGLVEPDHIPSAVPPTVGSDPDPTVTANPPTVGPTDPAPTEPAPDPTPPTLEPTEVPTDEPTEDPAQATSCAEVDGAGDTDDRGVGAPDFTHGSTQDAITTQLDADGEPYFQVPAMQHANPAAEAPVAGDLTGPGLDLGDSLTAAHSLGFRLTAAPEDGAVTYRNQTEDGVFADRGHAQQTMLLDRDVQVEHRWAPTRDAHATWSFTERGVYCVAYAVDGPRARAMETSPGTTKDLPPDDVLRFVVGDADPTSVDCAGESEDAVIPFPADDDGDGGDDGTGDDGSDDDGSDEDGSGDDDGSEGGLGGDEDDEDGDRGGLDGGDRDDDESEGGMDSRSDDEDEDDDEDETRVVAAPASAVVCPADGQTPRQLRDGDFALTVTDDGLRVADAASDATVPDGSSVVVGDTSRRTAAAGIEGFVAPGGQYLATGSTGAPGFTWSATGFDEPVDLQVQQTAGDGQVRVFLGEGTGVSADGGTLTVEPESSGTLLFGFDQPGVYAVTLSDGDDREVELEFVAGDRYASAQAGTMMNTLFSACPDVSWATDLLTAQQPETREDAQQSDKAQAQQQTSNGLGRGWWGVAGAGMTLAGLLLVAILVVVLREARR